MISRREFLQLRAGVGTLTGVGKLGSGAVRPRPGLQGARVRLHARRERRPQHGRVARQRAVRGLSEHARRPRPPDRQLLPITDPTFGAFGLHHGVPELQALFNQGGSPSSRTSGCWSSRRRTAPSPTRPCASPPTCARTRTRSRRCRPASPARAAARAGAGAHWIRSRPTTHRRVPGRHLTGRPAIYCAGAVTEDMILQPGNELSQQGLKFGAGRGGATADPRRGQRERDHQCGERGDEARRCAEVIARVVGHHHGVSQALSVRGSRQSAQGGRAPHQPERPVRRRTPGVLLQPRRIRHALRAGDQPALAVAAGQQGARRLRRGGEPRSGSTSR